jgi:hypothetical protein
MGCLLCLLIGGLLYVAGDQVSAWLWPTLAPMVGSRILLGGFLLIGALLWAPSRFLAQAVVLGVLTTGLVILRVLVQGFLAMFRLMWTSGRTALARLWGDVR